MFKRLKNLLAGELVTVLFGLVVAGLYLLPALFNNVPYRPQPGWFFAFFGLSYLTALLFRSCFRSRYRSLSALPDRLQPLWLFRLTVFCIEWVRAVAGMVLMIWWGGGLFYIHNFFSSQSPAVSLLVGLLHSALIYFLAQLNLRLFDMIGYGATQD